MRKTMTAATTCLALICTLPQPGICFDPSTSVKELMQEAESGDANALLARLAQLEQEFSSSENPIADGRALLRILVNEINAKTGNSYTVSEFCNMIRANIDFFQIPEEFKGECLEVLTLMETEESSQIGHLENEWSFFKKKKKHKKNKQKEKIPDEFWPIVAVILGAVGICIILPGAAPAALYTIGNAAVGIMSHSSDSSKSSGGKNGH